jgi:hypothetical protein
MKRLATSIATVSAAAVLTCTGAFTLPAVAAAHSATHKLSFISVSGGMVVFSKKSVGFENTDTNKAGKTIGFDESIFVAKSATVSNANVTVVIKGGLLYGTFTISETTGKVTNGKVTGGTGAFKHAKGTFTAKDLSSTKTAIKITYHT